MANQRYYIKCNSCGETRYLGKSLGFGIYNQGGYKAADGVSCDKWEFVEPSTLEEHLEWLWDHVVEEMGESVGYHGNDDYFRIIGEQTFYRERDAT